MVRTSRLLVFLVLATCVAIAWLDCCQAHPDHRRQPIKAIQHSDDSGINGEIGYETRERRNSDVSDSTDSFGGDEMTRAYEVPQAPLVRRAAEEKENPGDHYEKTAAVVRKEAEERENPADYFERIEDSAEEPKALSKEVTVERPARRSTREQHYPDCHSAPKCNSGSAVSSGNCAALPAPADLLSFITSELGSSASLLPNCPLGEEVKRDILMGHVSSLCQRIATESKNLCDTLSAISSALGSELTLGSDHDMKGANTMLKIADIATSILQSDQIAGSLQSLKTTVSKIVDFARQWLPCQSTGPTTIGGCPGSVIPGCGNCVLTIPKFPVPECNSKTSGSVSSGSSSTSKFPGSSSGCLCNPGSSNSPCNLDICGSKGSTGSSKSPCNIGTCGSQGCTGSSNSPCTIGTCGSQGCTGSSKSPCNIGTCGSQGCTGSSKSPCNIGTCGSQGCTGSSKSPCNIGTCGSQGCTGSSKSPCNIGTCGSQGCTGSSKSPCNIGTCGSQGCTGPSNSPCNLGICGSKGSTGPSNSPCNLGTCGSKGSTGSSNSPCNLGICDSKGSTGSSNSPCNLGICGSKGSTGPSNSPCDLGICGSKGSTGPSNSPCNLGICGSKGSTGSSNSPCNLGTCGSQGCTGSSNSPCNLDICGSQGSTGSSNPLNIFKNQNPLSCLSPLVTCLHDDGCFINAGCCASPRRSLCDFCEIGGSGANQNNFHLFPLVLPKFHVCQACGTDELCCGDIVTIGLPNKEVLGGKVFQDLNQIGFNFVHDLPHCGPNNKVWKLDCADFLDSTCAKAFQQLCKC